MIKTLAQIVPGCQKKDSATGNVVGVGLKLGSAPSLSCYFILPGKEDEARATCTVALVLYVILWVEHI